MPILGNFFKVPRLGKIGTGLAKSQPSVAIKPIKPPKANPARLRAQLGVKKLSGDKRLSGGFTDKAQPTKMYSSREELRKATQAQSRTSQGLTSVKKMPTVGYAKPRNLPTKKKRFGIFSNGDRYRTYNFRYPRYTRNYNFAYPY